MNTHTVSAVHEAGRLAFRGDGDPAVLVEETLVVRATNAGAASKVWVTDQYDHYVCGNTALAGPGDANVTRVVEETGRETALSTDMSGWYTKLDPYAGAQQALVKAYCNVCTIGAIPAVVIDYLNFRSPECSDAMWQLVTVMTGLADGYQRLGVPVTSENVSLYNSSGNVMGTKDYSINPTPVAGILGLMDDVCRMVPNGFAAPGRRVVLLGMTRPKLDGSTWIRDHGCLGGHPPVVDFDVEEALGQVLIFGAERGLHLVAHDLSIAGLAGALADMVCRGRCGVEIDLTKWGGEFGSTEELFSESQARALVAVAPDRPYGVSTRAEAVGTAALEISVTSRSSLYLMVDGGVTELSVAQLQAAREVVLPGCFD